jgi:hypothetical protein
MNQYEMVVLIVAILGVTGIMRARYGISRVGRRMQRRDRWRDESQVDDAEKAVLREEMQALKERVAVLERIVTDKSISLADEIERLRDQRVD